MGEYSDAAREAARATDVLAATVREGRGIPDELAEALYFCGTALPDEAAAALAKWEGRF